MATNSFLRVFEKRDCLVGSRSISLRRMRYKHDYILLWEKELAILRERGKGIDRSEESNAPH